MRPLTLSASGFQVASGCMKRFKAEYVDRARGIGTSAASTGTACHAALENFVKLSVMDHKMPRSLSFLEQCYDIAFTDTFGSADFGMSEYADGKELVTTWFDRMEKSDAWKGRRVISTEIKETYPIALNDDTSIPLNYIMDRVDVLVDTERLRAVQDSDPKNSLEQILQHTLTLDFEIEVVDYKTNFFPISQAELRKKIQARIYALIMQIKFPKAKGIWVTFDMLRHTPVTVYFSATENAASWYWLNAEVARILNFDPDEAEKKPTLNPECKFCTVKATCKELTANVSAGGIFGLTDQECVDLLVELQAKTTAQKTLQAELEDRLGTSIRKLGDDNASIQGTVYDAIIAARVVRSVDPERVSYSVAPEIYRDYISPGKLTLGQFEKMLKDDRLAPGQAGTLRSLVSKTVQTPSVKVVKRG